MPEYIVHKRHTVGMVATITVYCAVCGAFHTVTETQLTPEAYTRILQVLIDVYTEEYEKHHA